MPRLYVGRLNQRVGERELRKFFDSYGKIREIMMKNGYAFLDFDDYRDADDAVYELNGKELLGDRVMIEHAKGIERGVGGAPGGYRSDRRDRDRDRDRDRNDRYDDRSGGPHQTVAARKQRAREKYGLPVRTKYQVRIENLSSKVSWQDLKDYIRPHADVTYADAHRKERNVAIVCVASRSDLKNLFRKVDDVELNGKRIKIIDQSNGDRSRSRSRSRRRSRSRSHSRSNSRSRSQSRSRSRSKNNRRSRSRSHSRKSHSPESPKKDKRSSRSRSASRSRSKSKSKSKSKSRSPSRSRSRSRSKSTSPRD